MEAENGALLWETNKFIRIVQETIDNFLLIWYECHWCQMRVNIEFVYFKRASQRTTVNATPATPSLSLYKYLTPLCVNISLHFHISPIFFTQPLYSYFIESDEKEFLFCVLFRFVVYLHNLTMAGYRRSQTWITCRI